MSVLPPGEAGQPYDRKAAIYDALIGSRWYNRILWGADRDEYAAFAAQALRSAPAGYHLDAGCGSLVGTAAAYAAAPSLGVHRPSLLVDASIGMLRRARRRLGGTARAEAAGVTLLQGDLRTLPLHAGVLHSALFMGMLHLFDDPGARGVLVRMARALLPDASLHLTSLVLGRKRGDRYLRLLERAGEVSAPRSPDALIALVESAGFRLQEVRQRGSMLFAIARAEPSGG
ncbi:MAG TPA: class I SAM-dependent methyltransferase [Gemmatimonadales bacterium]|nr:class I SAM-dependent methyltransferase [Gemmatimonadales bacterium]